MTITIELRDAHTEDAMGIAKIQVETWQDSYPGIIPDDVLTGLSIADHTIDWARSMSLRNNGARTFVVSQHRSVLGFVSVGPSRSPDLPYKGEIYALYVATDWQNQGLGRALMGRAFVALMEARVNSAVVWCLSKNPSRFFYEGLGGRFAATRSEAFAGTTLQEAAYGWSDLEAWRLSQK